MNYCEGGADFLELAKMFGEEKQIKKNAISLLLFEIGRAHV